MAKKQKAIVTPLQKMKILSLYKENNFSMKELAEKFNHTLLDIKAIIHNLESSVYHARLMVKKNEHNIKDPANEIWKKLKVETRNRYEVSNYGRIKSFANNPGGTILKGKLQGSYLMFDYLDLKDGVRKNALIHRLVASHFIGIPTKAKPNVIHKDGNKANNRVENLQYASALETGVHHVTNDANSSINELRKAKSSRGRKLTLTQVETIRKILSNPNKQTKKTVLAARYNVTTMTIYRIQNGENWGSKGTPINYTKKVQNLLPAVKVIAIKKLLAKQKMTQKAIAEKYGTTEVVVCRIKKGKTYKAIG